MERRVSDFLSLGLIVTGFTVYLGGIALSRSPLPILTGLLIVITGMTGWAVSGLNNTPRTRRTLVDALLEVDPSREHAVDRPLHDHAEFSHAEVQADPPEPGREPQRLSSSVT